MPLSADDYLEIQGLYSRFGHLADEGKAEQWAWLFTPDGVFVVRGTAGAQDRVMRGTAELVAFQQGHVERFRRRGIRHSISNVAIEPAESGARGAAYLTALRVGDQQPPLVTATGRYADELVKTTEGWRFRFRTYTPD